MDDLKKPWRLCFILDEAKTFKAKSIEFNLGKYLYYQYHHKITEVLTIAQLSGRIILRRAQHHYDIWELDIFSFKAKHRIKNPFKEPLIVT